MKTKCMTLILAGGMLAALPAYSFPWFNKGTYDSRLGYKPQPAATANAQSANAQGKGELQVAVMANAKASGADMWHGTDQRARATHSR